MIFLASFSSSHFYFPSLLFWVSASSRPCPQGCALRVHAHPASSSLFRTGVVKDEPHMYCFVPCVPPASAFAFLINPLPCILPNSDGTLLLSVCLSVLLCVFFPVLGLSVLVISFPCVIAQVLLLPPSWLVCASFGDVFSFRHSFGDVFFFSFLRFLVICGFW
jgi:hypothetical protein